MTSYDVCERDGPRGRGARAAVVPVWAWCPCYRGACAAVVPAWAWRPCCCGARVGVTAARMRGFVRMRLSVRAWPSAWARWFVRAGSRPPLASPRFEPGATLRLHEQRPTGLANMNSLPFLGQRTTVREMGGLFMPIDLRSFCMSMSVRRPGFGLCPSGDPGFGFWSSGKPAFGPRLSGASGSGFSFLAITGSGSSFLALLGLDLGL